MSIVATQNQSSCGGSSGSNNNGSPDNIRKSKSIGVVGNVLAATLAAKLNSIDSFVIDEKEIFDFKAIVSFLMDAELRTAGQVYRFHIENHGKGTYGNAEGGITVTAGDIVMDYSGEATLPDIESEATQIIQFIDVGATPIQDYLNAMDPPIVIQNQSFGLVLIKTDSGNYWFLGSGGTYGFGEGTTEADDFQLLGDTIEIIGTSAGINEVLETGSTAYDKVMRLENTSEDTDELYYSEVGPQGISVAKSYQDPADEWGQVTMIPGGFMAHDAINSSAVQVTKRRIRKFFNEGPIQHVINLIFPVPGASGEEDISFFSGSGTVASEAFSENLITLLKDGVAVPGDTLQKLYNLIVGSSSEVIVADTAARNAYNIPHIPYSLFVIDDGDGKWAKYQAITTGVGATFVKLSDPDLLNAVMSNAAIKTAYESNADTNAFTNLLKAKLVALSGTNTGDETATSLGALIGGSAAKGAPVDADYLALRDSVTGLMQKLSWANLKTALSDGFVGMTLYKINFKNTLNTFTSFFTNSNTAARTYTFQDRNGVIADDIDLALKAPVSSTENYFIRDMVTSAAVTGTVVTTILSSKFVPGNTFASGSEAVYRNVLDRTGTGATASYSLYVNSSNTLAGATLVATYTNPNSAKYAIFKRLFTFKPGDIMETTGDGNVLTDDVTGGTVGSFTYEVAQGKYWILAVQPNTSGDSFRTRSTTLKGIK